MPTPFHAVLTICCASAPNSVLACALVRVANWANVDVEVSLGRCSVAYQIVPACSHDEPPNAVAAR